MSDGKATVTRVKRAYEQFLSGVTPSEGAVRSMVQESWVRSRSRGVGDDPDVTPDDMSDNDFSEYRAAHRLAQVRPLITSLMLDDVADAGVVVALTDRRGRLLWVDGDRSTRGKAAKINFVEGTVWSEDQVGTNAPGLALSLDRGVQIIGPEHYASPVQKWNCAAAPVHDPLTGEVIGAIDVTGGAAAAAPFALAAVRSVVAAVERELRSTAVDLSPEAMLDCSLDSRLTVLAGEPTWCAPGGRRHVLSPRHAEILLLLHLHPEGLSTDRLADLLSDDDLGSVTVRAEISRLRREVGDAVASRPYRLTGDVSSDVTDVRQNIMTGDLRAAVSTLGRGGLLADSLAPGIIDAFDEIREDLRSAVFASRDVATLQAWASSPHGHDDFQAWTTLHRALPSGHPDAAIAAGRVRLLNRRFGV
ncbi:transcriptional regulator [Gordonia liuliyuniae]|uniref:Transcriptional regulator n=1 Tax=Gordonia liuliyuniae TaxID=2911517 RepID=A0ABS9ITD7_9ACTN|nr:transcriptional regulator [Gordonia liuliyuniae]MCF8588813.1 transcriptional regulator [Gordonia liuliyuniae]